MITEIRLIQFEKALLPIEVIPSGMVAELNFLQLLKVLLSIVFTDEGTVIEARLMQSEKADSPIEVTPSERVAELSFPQLLKA
jgi:hypothetical protein